MNNKRKRKKEISSQSCIEYFLKTVISRSVSKMRHVVLHPFDFIVLPSQDGGAVLSFAEFFLRRGVFAPLG